MNIERIALRYTGRRGRGKDPDEISFPGIDFSNREPMRVVTVDSQHDVLVVRHSGGSCWSGIGRPRVTIPAKFLVFKILLQNSFSDTTHQWTEYSLEMLAEIPVSVGRKKKSDVA